jgi:hypothetical protein
MATVRLQLRRGTEAQWDSANPTLAAGEIGIETDTNTFKFGDGSTAWNSLSYALSQTVDDYILLNTKGVANGVASLDSSGFIPSAQLPPLAKVTVSSAANQAARLALTAEPGDIAIQADNGTTYVLASSPASTNGNWREISATAAISAAIATHESDTTAVHGIADTSLLATTANVATAKSEAISAAASAAGTALSNHESDTTAVHGIADTSILATTTGTQTLTNKTLTSPAINTPTGITKSDVGLSNVDNTSDENKPVSLATLTALDLKAPLNSPALTGNATAVNLTLSGNLTVNGSTSTINSTTLTVQDKDIVLGQTATPTDAAADQGGIVLKGTTDKSIKYSLAKSAWDISENINIPGDKAVKINNIDVLTVSTVLGKALPGVVVGTSETQTLTNKTINSPTIDIPTFTGTFSLPITTSIGNVSADEMQMINGVTSNVQTQIDAKAPSASPTFTGTVSLPSTTSIGLVSATELELLNGVTANVQTQIDAKAPSASPTFTGTVSLPSTTSIGLVSAEELELLNGVTANVQTQIDAKLASATAATTYAPLAAPTFTGAVVLPATTTIGLVDSTEMGYLNGVTSSVQTQLTAGVTALSAHEADTTNIHGIADTSALALTATVNSGLALKANLASPTFTGTVSLPATTSIGNISSIELDLLNGASSNIQTQIDAKAPLASPTFTGTVTLPVGTVTSGMIADGAVATADVADVAISTAKIADAAVTTAKIADDSITSAKIVAGTIVNSDINASAGIDWTKLGISSTVDSTEIGYVNGVTSAIQTQIDAKLASATAATTYAPLASPTFTGTVTLPVGTVTAGMILDGTIMNADINAAAEIATSKISGLDTALGLKAPLASPTFTGTVSGITKTMVGLGSADNTADTAKPVSTAQASAIATAKAEAIADATSQVNALLTGAPAALNTLDELAAALGDDANFASSVTTSLGLKVDSLTPISQKTASYTLSSLTERDDLIEMSSASALVLTIPTDATLNYPIGTSIDILQTGAGQVTIAPVSGTVTVNATPGLKLRTTWSSATLLKRAANTWVVFGDLTA